MILFCTTEENREPKHAFTTWGKHWRQKKNVWPVDIWFKFNKDHAVAKIGFRSDNKKDHGSWYLKLSPKKFDIIGSSEGCQEWTTLLSVEDAGFTLLREFRFWDIPCENQRRFSCVGLRIYSSKGHSGWVSLKDVKMWEAEKVESLNTRNGQNVSGNCDLT